MNSTPHLTSQRLRARRGPRDARLDCSATETDSVIFDLFESSVLVVARSGSDLQSALADVACAGFSIVAVDASAGVEALAFLPRFALIETAMPGALELIERINGSEPVVQVLALLGVDEAEGPALAAGATLTLRRPLCPADVLLCMSRFRAQGELQRQKRQGVGAERGAAPTAILESVLATVGHEIKNPLAAALAGVECLREPDVARRLDEEARIGAVDDVGIALCRIRDVMSAVTSLVCGSAPELQRTSLWDCAERAVGALRASAARIELAGDPSVGGFANSALLEQVLVNLLQNAVDATLDTPDPRILVRVYRAGLEARISVRDNGPGVPLAIRQRIFDPFVTTKGERGTGLGLVLVQHAVGRMGGTVTLGPAPTGAVFRVRLQSA